LELSESATKAVDARAGETVPARDDVVEANIRTVLSAQLPHGRQLKAKRKS
jgi:hypothetical protein